MSSKKLKKGGASKKKAEEFEPGSWECTVCTFRNNFEAFKCDMCDTRKGTSTRKPRLNFNVVQQQTLVQNLAVQNERALKKQRNSDSRSRNSPESNTSSHIAGPSGFGSSTASGPIAGPSEASSSSCFDNLTPERIQTLLNRPNRQFPAWLVDLEKGKSTEVTTNGVTHTIIEFPCRLPNFNPYLPYDRQRPADAEGNDVETADVENGDAKKDEDEKNDT